MAVRGVLFEMVSPVRGETASGQRAVRGVLFEMVSPVLVERFWQARQMGLTDELLGAEVGLSERGAAKYAARCGGLAPRPWKNLDRLLSFEERCRIKELLVEGKGVRAIARALDRSPSTISRELRRVGACVTAPSQYLSLIHI